MPASAILRLQTLPRPILQPRHLPIRVYARLHLSTLAGPCHRNGPDMLPDSAGYSYQFVDPTWPWHSSLGCTVTFSEASSTLSFPTVTSIRDGRTVVTSAARTEVGIGAYGVEIRFQATDFVESTTVSTISTEY
jgi:hypothetical protein